MIGNRVSLLPTLYRSRQLTRELNVLSRHIFSQSDITGRLVSCFQGLSRLSSPFPGRKFQPEAASRKDSEGS